MNAGKVIIIPLTHLHNTPLNPWLQRVKLFVWMKTKSIKKKRERKIQWFFSLAGKKKKKYISVHNDLNLQWEKAACFPPVPSLLAPPFRSHLHGQERSSHRTHFSARFPSLSHLSLQDYYTSLVLAPPLLLNEAPGGALWAYRLMAAYTHPTSATSALHGNTSRRP